jgi:tetratricopeptide (TPR) repeat protein
MPKTARTAASRGDWFWQEIYERNYQAALRRLALTSEVAFKSEEEFTPRSLLEGLAYRLMNERHKAQTSFQAARVLLEEELKAQPDNPRIHRSLGIVYAGLGNKSDAIREGKLSTNLYPVSKDALAGPEYVASLALIYVMVEEYDAAFDQIEYLVSIPSSFSVSLLKLDPHWDPLRSHPRYQKIIKNNQPAL